MHSGELASRVIENHINIAASLIMLESEQQAERICTCEAPESSTERETAPQWTQVLKNGDTIVERLMTFQPCEQKGNAIIGKIKEDQ